jgi:predicted CoA-binding protein
MKEEQTREFPESNPPDDEIKAILENSKAIAVVGLSDKPERPSYQIAKYLKEHGYAIIPVNPARSEILGEQSYPDLSSIPSPVDIVDIFRNIEAVPGIVEEAIKIKTKVVWMQLGLAHKKSAQKAKDAGLIAVQSKCIKVEHARLTG